MMRICSLFILALFCVFRPVYAQDALAVEIAKDHIDITVGFTGSSIELFGDRRDPDAVVAIVVEGPRKDVTIWKRAQIFGAWINSSFVKFHDIPAYYSYSFSGEEQSAKENFLFIKHGIGHEGMFSHVKTKHSKSVNDFSPYEKALVEQKIANGLYFKKKSEMVFLNENFFRVHFDIPGAAPTGEYKIHSFLIKDGKVIEREETSLKVGQVGLNAFVFNAAHEYSVFYALFCIFLALFSGWFASVLKVRP